MHKLSLATGLAVIGLVLSVSACVPGTYTHEQLSYQNQFGQRNYGGPFSAPFTQPYQTGFQGHQPNHNGFQQHQPLPFPGAGYQGGFYR